MYAPAGKKDGIQVIPLAEVAAKDEFTSIKYVTHDDQLAMQRIPPQLMGILPNNTGGFGDVEKAARVFAINELAPLQERLMEINDWRVFAVLFVSGRYIHCLYLVVRAGTLPVLKMTAVAARVLSYVKYDLHFEGSRS